MKKWKFEDNKRRIRNNKKDELKQILEHQDKVPQRERQLPTTQDGFLSSIWKVILATWNSSRRYRENNDLCNETLKNALYSAAISTYPSFRTIYCWYICYSYEMLICATLYKYSVETTK